MTLTDSEHSLFRITLVTLEMGNPGYSTVYSAVYTAFQPQTATWTYLSSSVGTCGAQRVSECAEQLVAQADKAADGPRQFYSTYKPSKCDAVSGGGT
jgi:hypothetical protein